MISRWTQNKNISSNIHSLLGNGIQAALGFITFLVVVRFTDKLVFGNWVIFITVATLMDMLRLGLTGTATIRMISVGQKNDRYNSIGASYQLSLVSSFLISSVFLLIYFVMITMGLNTTYSYVFLFYPILAFSNIPFNQSTIIAQGKCMFSRLAVIKAINSMAILILLLLYLFFNEKFELEGLVYVYIFANAITSLIVIIKKWDGLLHFFSGTPKTRKEILNFGKYSTLSYISSNLLKSSDAILLGLAPFMGAEYVAIYAIPFKFVEMIEVVLRSFATTAFPTLSKLIKNQIHKFYAHLQTYIVITTLLFIPIVIVFILFPDLFLSILGGDNYVQDIQVQKNILYIISVYILFLPLDRFTGVALFALDKAKLNFLKIMFMLCLNLIFDFIAIYLFKSLELVAFATLVFTFFGVILGWVYINQVLSVEYGINIKRSKNILKQLLQLGQWKQIKEEIIH